MDTLVGAYLEAFVGEGAMHRARRARGPDHTTLSRRSATLAVPRLQPTAADGDTRRVHLLVDSTGLKL
jgi:hypothetical protein